MTTKNPIETNAEQPMGENNRRDEESSLLAAQSADLALLREELAMAKNEIVQVNIMKSNFCYRVCVEN